MPACFISFELLNEHEPDRPGTEIRIDVSRIRAWEQVLHPPQADNRRLVGARLYLDTGNTFLVKGSAERVLRQQIETRPEHQD